MSNENLDSTLIKTSRSQDDTQPVSPKQNVSLDVNIMDYHSNSQNDTLPLSQIDTPGSQLDTQPVSPIKGLNRTGNPDKPLHFACDGKDPRIETENPDVSGMDSDTDFSDGDNELNNSNTRGYSQASTADLSTTCGIEKGSSDPMSVQTSVNSSHSLTNSHSSGDFSVTGNVSRVESIGKTSNSDDSEVIQSSQDIFSSQPVSSGSHDQPSSSQLVPTFQLSGEVTAFEPNFVPSRLLPSTPSVHKDRGANANTSTPVRSAESAEAKSSEIISLSDDEISITINDKNTSPLGDKRKLSDGSDDSGRAVPASKRLCRNQSNSRQSVMVVAEVCKSVKHPTPSENSTQSESQAFHLHFSASQSDQDTPDSQTTSGSSSVNQTGSWKSNWESNPSTSSNELKESSYCDTISKDCSSSNHNVTIFQVEDPEDDVQLILPKNPHTFEEITLDTSGNRPGTSVDGIEVLSPADKPNAWKQSSTSVGPTRANFVTPCSSPTVPGVLAPPLTGFPSLNQRFRAKFLTPPAPDAESLNIWKPSSLGQIQGTSVTHCSSPAIASGPPPPLSFSVPNQRFRAKHSTPQTPGVESPHGNLSSIHDPDHSKENIQPAKQPGIIEYEREFYVTFTKTCKMICKASVNAEEKKVVHVSVEKLQDGEAKTISNDELKKELSSHEDDTSSIPSQGSPGSVMSGPGPFNLPKRQSIVSTISSSSASSSASGMYHRGAGYFPHFRTGNASHVEVDFQSTSRQEMDPLFKDLVLHDTSCPSTSGSQVLDQWASTSSHLMRQWVDGLVKNELIDGCEVLPEQKLSAVQEIGDEETLGVVIPTVKKLPAARGRKKKAAADKRIPSKSVTPRSTRKNSRQVEKTPVDERTPGTTVASTEITRISVQDPPTHPSTSTPEVTKVQTPRKKPVRGVADKPNPRPSQEHASLTSIDFFEPGAPVFALYNGFYYPAELQSLARSNYWNVIFHDGLKSTVNVKFIRLFNTLEIGQAVFAKSGNLDYAHGVVTAITPLPGKDDMYTVDLHEAGTVTVPKSDLGLSVEQAKAFMNDTQPDPAASSSLSSSPHKRTPGTKPREMLDLGQVIDSKRRTPKQSGCSSPCQPGVSNTARRLISDSSSSQEDGPLATVIVAGVEPEQEGFSCADPLARKGKGMKGKSTLPDIEDEDTIKKFGPLPAEGSRIFAGKWFLLTCTDARPIHRTRVDLDSSRQSSDIETDDGIITKHNPDLGVDKMIRHNTDSECFEFTSCPLSKERLCRQIELGGGKVVKDLTEIPPKELKNTYVVTNRPCLTPTYIMCIIRGVQSLSHDYIIACCKENEKLSSELHNSILPVGYSVVRRGFVVWREHKTKSPLHGINVLVAGDGSFKKFWEEVVCMAGAKVVNLKANKGMEQVTVIVSDNPCEDTILQAAHKHRIPIVSPGWVKQSLINNTALSFDAHRSFAYDAVDTD